MIYKLLAERYAWASPEVVAHLTFNQLWVYLQPTDQRGGVPWHTPPGAKVRSQAEIREMAERIRARGKTDGIQTS